VYYCLTQKGPLPSTLMGHRPIYYASPLDETLLITDYCYGVVSYKTSHPCNCDHFLIYCAPHLSSNHSCFIHQSSLLWLQQWHLVAKRGQSKREIASEFCLSVSLTYPKGSLTCRKTYDMRLTASLLRRKSCCGFLSLLKINHLCSVLNPRTLRPVASTITITPPRTSRCGTNLQESLTACHGVPEEKYRCEW
jgi:hypothetical protein